MGAMAQALGVRLGKPGVYVLNPAGQVPQTAQLQRSVQLAGRVVLVMAVCSAVVLLAAGGVVYG